MTPQKVFDAQLKNIPMSHKKGFLKLRRVTFFVYQYIFLNFHCLTSETASLSL